MSSELVVPLTATAWVSMCAGGALWIRHHLRRMTRDLVEAIDQRGDA